MEFREKWSARQELHLRSLRPGRSMLLLHHALFAPDACQGAGGLWFGWKQAAPSLDGGPR